MRVRWLIGPAWVCVFFACSSVGDHPGAAIPRNFEEAGRPDTGVDAPVLPPPPDPLDSGLTDTSPPSSSFGPGSVYMVGATTTDVTNPLYALLDLQKTTTFYVGFPGKLPGASTIRPSDSRLVYGTNPSGAPSHLYEFTSDALVGPNGDYPPMPVANDTVLPTPQCPATEGADSLRIFPDDSVLLYRCYDGNWYVAGSTTSFFKEGMGLGYLVAVGAGRTALIERDGGLLILKDGAQTAVVGLEPTAPLTRVNTAMGVRFKSGKFFVGLELRPDLTGSAGLAPNVELRTIALDATTQTLGAYDLGGYVGRYIRAYGVLDLTDKLYLMMYQADAGADDVEVTQFSVGSPPVTVYDDAHHTKRVKTIEPKLVTGP